MVPNDGGTGDGGGGRGADTVAHPPTFDLDAFDLDGSSMTRYPSPRASAGRLHGVRIAPRGWFYHKAVWLVLPGGKKYVLTARVHKPLFGQAEGQLVLLEMPQVGAQGMSRVGCPVAVVAVSTGVSIAVPGVPPSRGVCGGRRA